MTGNERCRRRSVAKPFVRVATAAAVATTMIIAATDKRRRALYHARRSLVARGRRALTKNVGDLRDTRRARVRAKFEKRRQRRRRRQAATRRPARRLPTSFDCSSRQFNVAHHQLQFDVILLH